MYITTCLNLFTGGVLPVLAQQWWPAVWGVQCGPAGRGGAGGTHYQDTQHHPLHGRIQPVTACISWRHSMKTIDSVELGFGLNNVTFFSVFNTATPICRILVTQPVIEHHCNIGTSMTTLSQAVKPIQLHTIIAPLSDSTLFCAAAMAMPVFLHLCNSIYACF